MGLEFVFDQWCIRNIVPLFDTEGLKGIYEHYERATSKFGIPLAVTPQDLRYLAYALMESGRLEEAHSVLFHDVEHYPPAIALLHKLALRYEQQQAWDQMRSLHHKVLEIDPDNKPSNEKIRELEE